MKFNFGKKIFYLLTLLLVEIYIFLLLFHLDTFSKKTIILLAAVAIYLGLFFLKKYWLKNIDIIALFIFSLLFCLILIGQTNYLSSDLFNYIFQAKIFTYYNDNPYINPPANYAGDPFCSWVCDGYWKNLTNTYGPLWFYFSLLPGYLSSNIYILNIFLFKFFIILIFLLSGWLVKLIQQINNPNNIKLGIFLFLFNPLLIYEAAGNSHNDIVLIFFILLSIFLMQKKKFVLSYLALFASLLIKYITLPLLIIYFFSQIFSRKNKLSFTLLIILLSLLFLVFAFAPIWTGTNIFQGIIQQNELINPLNNSPLHHLGVLSMVAFGQNDKLPAIKIFNWLLYGISVLFIIFQFIKPPKPDNQNIIKAYFWVLIFLLLIPLTWIQPWYYCWLLPLALINKYYKWFFIITIVGILTYILPNWFCFYLLIIIFLFQKSINQHLFLNLNLGNNRKNNNKAA